MSATSLKMSSGNGASCALDLREPALLPESLMDLAFPPFWEPLLLSESPRDILESDPFKRSGLMATDAPSGAVREEFRLDFPLLERLSDEASLALESRSATISPLILVAEPDWLRLDWVVDSRLRIPPAKQREGQGRPDNFPGPSKRRRRL